MNIFNLWRQTERAGIDPTLSGVFAKGIALEEQLNHFDCNIGEDYADYNGNPLIECFFSFVKVFIRQSTLHPLSLPQIGEATYVLY